MGTRPSGEARASELQTKRASQDSRQEQTYIYIYIYKYVYLSLSLYVYIYIYISARKTGGSEKGGIRKKGHFQVTQKGL